MKLNTLGKVFLFGTLAALLAASFGCERLRDALQKTQQNPPKNKVTLQSNGRPDFYSLTPSGRMLGNNESTRFSSLMLVDPLQRFNPIKLATDIKPEAFQSIILGSTNREWQKAPLFAMGVYARDGRLFKINLTALTNKPTPQQISNEENANNICKSKLIANQTAHPDQAFFYYRLPGNNQVCNDTDDTHFLVRLDADTQTDPIGLYNEPIPSYDAEGKLSHWLYASLGKLTASNLDFSINDVIRDGIQSVTPMIDGAFGGYHYLTLNENTFVRINLQNNQINEFALPNKVVRGVDGAYLIQTINATNPNNAKEIPGTHIYWWSDREPTPKLLSSLPADTEVKQTLVINQELVFISQNKTASTPSSLQIQKLDAQSKLSTLVPSETNAELKLYPYITDQAFFYQKTTSSQPENKPTTTPQNNSQDYQFDISKNAGSLLDGRVVDGIVNPSKGRFYQTYAVSSLLLVTPNKTTGATTSAPLQLIEYDLNNKTSITIATLSSPYEFQPLNVNAITENKASQLKSLPTTNIAQGNVWRMSQFVTKQHQEDTDHSIIELISYVPGNARSGKQLTQHLVSSRLSDGTLVYPQLGSVEPTPPPPPVLLPPPISQTSVLSPPSQPKQETKGKGQQ